MLTSNGWLARAAMRLGAHLVCGGVTSALVGALCVGATGALLGWIMDIDSTPPSWDSGYLFPGAWLGAYLGCGGGIVGAFAAGAVAFDERARHSLAPLRATLMRVALGQSAGTLGALSCYFLLVMWLVFRRAQPFVGTVEDNLDLIIPGAPCAMICGAIAGALWKKSETSPHEI